MFKKNVTSNELWHENLYLTQVGINISKTGLFFEIIFPYMPIFICSLFIVVPPVLACLGRGVVF